ncbi:MAG TPA: helix-turn-helix domain-containing protein [Candidatus Thermoplasmatota archaeon]
MRSPETRPYCPYQSCADKGLTTGANLRPHGRGDRLRCTTCGHTFTTRHFHPLFPLRTDEKTIAQILLDLSRRRSIHEAADHAGVSTTTVQNVIHHMDDRRQELSRLLTNVLRMPTKQAHDVAHFLTHRDELKRKNRFK